MSGTADSLNGLLIKQYTLNFPKNKKESSLALLWYIPPPQKVGVRDWASITKQHVNRRMKPQTLPAPAREPVVSAGLPMRTSSPSLTARAQVTVLPGDFKHSHEGTTLSRRLQTTAAAQVIQPAPASERALGKLPGRADIAGRERGKERACGAPKQTA